MIENKLKPQITLQRKDLAELIPISSPLVLYVEASSYCNLACTFCPHYLGPDRLHKKNMSLDVFKKVINDLEQFPEPLDMLRMCGTGDPLMNKSLGDMLIYASKSSKFKKFEMITNGLLLSRELIDIIARSLTRIIISVEGLNDRDYLKFTNRKIKFSDIVRKVEDLYRCKGSCRVHVKIHNNAVSRDSERKLFEDIFTPISDELYIENLVDLWPETDATYINKIEHRFVTTSINEVKVCSQIFKTMQVNSDGSVIPCSIDWEAKNKIGKITEKSLIDIWNGREMLEIRVKHLNGLRKTFSPCSECSFNELSDIDNIDSKAEYIKTKILS